MSAVDVAGGAPPHAPGERFHCRVDVEDICISVEGSATSSTTNMFWEEARVACEFNGMTQRTRWIGLQSAMDEVKRELQSASGGNLSGAAAPQTGGLLALPYTAFNNLSYEVEFTAETSDDPSVTSVRTVKPKRFHMMELKVEAQNLHRVYSASGGQTGDRAPTSGNMEVISASLNKKAAKVSAWTRSIFSKLGSSEKEKKEEAGAGAGAGGGHYHHHRGSGKEQNEAALATLSNHPVSPSPAPPGTGTAPATDNAVHEGVYHTVVRQIDMSEAYNRPGGRQVYCLVVKPESRKMPDAGVGTPITISFTVVAHYGHTESVPRSFHNFAIVADQFVLDYSEASRVLPPDPKDENEQPRPIVGYAFGYTANTSEKPYALAAASKAVPVVGGGEMAPPEDASGSGGEVAAMRIIDFDRLHRELDERKRTPEDYKALPTSCCVVSGSTGSQPANKPRIGNRVLCVSRFKTSPDGLCKPSFKCQFVVSLVRYYGTYGESTREAAAPINLASLLNEEIMPQRIRTLKFELGEVMYLRLRRFSFAEPELLRAPLLLPYDYNNDDVHLPPPPQQQQQQQRASSTPEKPQTTQTTAAAAAAPQHQAPPVVATGAGQHDTASSNTPAKAAADAGVPAISFASSASSSSTSSNAGRRSPQNNQRSGSDSDASTPRVQPEVRRDPTAPFFTLEPQADAPAIHFGTADEAGGWGTSHNTAAQARAPPAFEMTPTPSNPFFSVEHDNDDGHRHRSSDQQPQPQQDTQPVMYRDSDDDEFVIPAQQQPQEENPYSFGSPDGDADEEKGKKTANTTAAFELTPFE